jgi:hypothetical protein
MVHPTSIAKQTTVVNWNAYSDPILAAKTRRKLDIAASVMVDGKVCQWGQAPMLDTRRIRQPLNPASFHPALGSRGWGFDWTGKSQEIRSEWCR